MKGAGRWLKDALTSLELVETILKVIKENRTWDYFKVMRQEMTKTRTFCENPAGFGVCSLENLLSM
jgi:uncharacterized FAD-dependent dehydrogenase